LIGWWHVIVRSHYDQGPTTYYPEMVPVLLGGVVVLYLLAFLYE